MEGCGEIVRAGAKSGRDAVGSSRTESRRILGKPGGGMISFKIWRKQNLGARDVNKYVQFVREAVLVTHSTCKTKSNYA